MDNYDGRGLTNLVDSGEEQGVDYRLRLDFWVGRGADWRR